MGAHLWVHGLQLLADMQNKGLPVNIIGFEAMWSACELSQSVRFISILTRLVSMHAMHTLCGGADALRKEVAASGLLCGMGLLQQKITLKLPGEVALRRHILLPAVEKLRHLQVHQTCAPRLARRS